MKTEEPKTPLNRHTVVRGLRTDDPQVEGDSVGCGVG